MRYVTLVVTLMCSLPAAAQEGEVEGVELGGKASAFAYDGKSGHLFAVLKGRRQIAHIDPGVGTVRKLETGPATIAVVVKGDWLVTLDADERSLMVCELAGGKQTGSVQLPLTNPSWLSASDGGDPYVYVASSAAQEGVLQVDVRAHKVRRRLPLWRSNGCFEVARSGTLATDGEFVYSLNEALGLAFVSRRIDSASGPVRPGTGDLSWVIGSSVYDLQGRQRLAIATTPLALDPRSGLVFSLIGRDAVFDAVQTYGLSEARPLETFSLRNFPKEGLPDNPPAAFVDAKRDRVVVAWGDRYGTVKMSALKNTNPPYVLMRNPFPAEVPEARAFRWTPEWATPELLAGAKYSLEGAPAGLKLDGAAVVYEAPPGDFTEKGFRYVVEGAGGWRCVLRFAFRGSRVTFEPSHMLDFAVEGAAYDERRGRLFLLDSVGERVVELDPTSGSVAMEYPTEKDPVVIAVADTSLLVLNRGSRTLTLHEIGSPKNAKSVRLTKDAPATLAASAGYAYVGGGNGPFWLAQVDIGAAKERAVLREGERTGSCVVSSDGRRIYERPLRSGGGGELHTLDVAKPSVSTDPIQRTMVPFLPVVDPQGRGWIFPSVLMDRDMSKTLAELRCDAPVPDPGGAWVFGWGPREVTGGPDYHGYLLVLSAATFKATRTARMAWLAHPPGFTVPPRPERAQPPRFLFADGTRKRVIAASLEKVHVVGYEQLGLRPERILQLHPPLPDEVAVGSTINAKLQFAKDSGFDGAVVTLQKGPSGMAIEGGTCRFTPMADQIGVHELQLNVRTGEEEHVLSQRLRVVPRFVTIPDEPSSVVIHRDGAAGLVVVGTRVSCVDLKSGETRSLADKADRVDAVTGTGKYWVVADTGVLRVFERSSLKELGVARTGGTSVRCIIVLPGEDRIVFAATEQGWHHVDLEKRLVRGALVNAPITGRGLSLERLAGQGQYLCHEPGRAMRVVWQDDRLLGQDFASCPVAVPLVQRERALVLFPTRGLTCDTDTTAVLLPAPKRDLPPFDLPVVWKAMPSRRLLAAFDSYTIRLVDPWKLTELRAIEVRERAAPSRVVAPVEPGRFGLEPTGSELLAWVRGRVYRVVVEDSADDVSKVPVGRFASLPSTLMLKPGDAFSYAPMVEGFGQGRAFFLKNGPTGLTVNETTGEVRWTVPADFKSAEVQIGVKDAQDTEASLRFTLLAAPK